MSLTIEDLAQQGNVFEKMVQFGKPFSQLELNLLKNDGFSVARSKASSCMAWIWTQWLLKADGEKVERIVSDFVARGLETHKLTSNFHYRTLHDLFLLHCAIYASSDSQLEAVAKAVVDSSGAYGSVPRNDGALYHGAYCGMLKYSILEDQSSCEKEYQVMKDAYIDPFRGAAKPLIKTWIEKNYDGFIRNQVKDFERLWQFADKHRIVVQNGGDKTLQLRKISTEQNWCWGHCGLAMLFHRKGAKVATDELWFPATALE